MTLHWIVQKGFEQERGWDVLYDTLTRFDLRHTLVRVVPFSHQLQPWIEPGGGPTVVMGSITLAKQAEQRFWYPGGFTGPNFHYRRWRAELSPYLLNRDATVGRFADVQWPEDHGPMFIRPCLDDKSFAGAVMDWQEFDGWRQKVLDLELDNYTTLGADTEVMWCEPREIHQECRFFIVGREIVTASQYKMGDQVILSEEAVSRECWDYCRRVVETWQPHRAFCLDVTLTESGYHVIEIGSISSCGFYDADVQKLIFALEDQFG